MAARTVTCPLPPDAPEAWEWKVRSGPLSWAERRGVWSLPCSALTRLLPPGPRPWRAVSASRGPLAPGNLSPGLPRWVALPFTGGCADEERVPWAPAQGGLEHTGAGQAVRHPRSQISAAAGTEPGPGSPASWKGHPALSDPGSLPRPVSHGPRRGGLLPNSLQTTADRVVPGVAAV